MNARQFFSFYEIDALIADVPAWFHVQSPRTLARTLLALDFIRPGQLRAEKRGERESAKNGVQMIDRDCIDLGTTEARLR